MSAFRQIKTEINDRPMLVAALKSLGYHPIVGTNLSVRGYRSETTKGFEVLLQKEHTKLAGDIGFKREKDGTYTLGLDTYVVRNVDPKEFMAKVKKAFFVKRAQRTAADAGLDFLSQEEVTRDGRKLVRLQYVKTGA